MKKFDQTPYKLPPPTPIHVPAENRPLEEKSLPFSKKRSKVRITPLIRRVSRRPELPMAPGQIPLSPVQIPLVQIPLFSEPLVPNPPVQIPQSQEPVQIPDIPEPVQIPDIPEPVQIPDIPEPVQIPDVPQPLVQIPDVPEPLVKIPKVLQPPVQIPPELDTLLPTDAFDQLMSFVLGHPAQELQLLHRVPSIFDGDLISFLDELEKELAMEPMHLTMPILNPCPNFGVHVPRSFGKTVIVFTSHLDLTWDKGVDLKFFRVGRSPSRQVREAYQPQNTEAYSLDLTYCTRLAYVYVTWLTWLDDREMHRDENLSWRMIKQHVQFTRLFCSCQRHQGKPLPIELSIATFSSDGSDPQVMGITVNHAELTSTQHELRCNSHEDERLVHTPLPKSVPVE
ncbi:hypothetical protein TNCV_533391 [Trichonephila clavipes]|nr:hypothetical protein TNCV_533391 [Trichonephila clavipes]